jgi:hypothetical protein
VTHSRHLETEVLTCLCVVVRCSREEGENAQEILAERESSADGSSELQAVGRVSRKLVLARVLDDHSSAKLRAQSALRQAEYRASTTRPVAPGAGSISKTLTAATTNKSFAAAPKAGVKRKPSPVRMPSPTRLGAIPAPTSNSSSSGGSSASAGHNSHHSAQSSSELNVRDRIVHILALQLMRGLSQASIQNRLGAEYSRAKRVAIQTVLKEVASFEAPGRYVLRPSHHHLIQPELWPEYKSEERLNVRTQLDAAAASASASASASGSASTPASAAAPPTASSSSSSSAASTSSAAANGSRSNAFKSSSALTVVPSLSRALLASAPAPDSTQQPLKKRKAVVLSSAATSTSSPAAPSSVSSLLTAAASVSPLPELISASALQRLEAGGETAPPAAPAVSISSYAEYESQRSVYDSKHASYMQHNEEIQRLL